MSYGSMAQATNIVKAFDFFDRLTEKAKRICTRFDIGPMQIMACGLDLNGRKGVVTGTDLPKMLGLVDAKYGDMRTVLAEKAGIIEPDFTESTPTRVGKFMEPFLASNALEYFESLLEHRQGQNPNGRFFITMGEFFQHPTLKLGTSTDMAIYQDEKLLAIAELKHTGADWDDEAPPDKVLVQINAQMMCSGADRVVVFGLTGGNRDEKTWLCVPNADWIAKIKEAVATATPVLETKKMPAVITYLKPPAVKVKPQPKVTQTFHRLAAELAVEVEEQKRLEARIAKMKKILGKRVKDGESLNTELFLAYRSLTTYQPKLSAEKALPAIEKALIEFIPSDKLKEASDKVLEIRQACTSDGSQTSSFTFKGKGEA